MTKGSYKSKEDLEKMTPEQIELYYNSTTFPDKFSFKDVELAAKLLSKGLYPWGV